MTEPLGSLTVCRVCNSTGQLAEARTGRAGDCSWTLLWTRPCPRGCTPQPGRTTTQPLVDDGLDLSIVYCGD